MLAAAVSAAQPHTAASSWASLEIEFSGLSASLLNPSSLFVLKSSEITWAIELWAHQWIQPSVKLIFLPKNSEPLLTIFRMLSNKLSGFHFSLEKGSNCMFWLQLASLTLTISPCLPTSPSQLAGTGSPVLLQPWQHVKPSSPFRPWLQCTVWFGSGLEEHKIPSLVPGDDLQSPLPWYPFCSTLSCSFLIAEACAFSSSLFPRHLWKGLAA